MSLKNRILFNTSDDLTLVPSAMAGVVLGFCFLLFIFCKGQNQGNSSLVPNSSLATGETRWLLSPKGAFYFGLVNPSPQKWYLGISYTWLDEANIWIANREKPAGAGAGVNFTKDGNVVLFDSQGVVWTTGTANKSVASARLYDSGNFALLNSTDGIVWQSFEHPSDTWMPGMEMRMAYKLVSWRSKVDPSPGRYSMRLRPTSEYVSLWNNTVQYWTSGIWNGNIFANVPQMTLNFLYNFTFVNTSSEDQYFTWSEKVGNGGNSSHFTLGVDGLIRVSILQGGSWYNVFFEPQNVCDVEKLCGAYGVCATGNPACRCPDGFQPQKPDDWQNQDWSSGCIPKSAPGCDGRKVLFSSLPSTSFDSNGSSRLIPGTNKKSCEKMCTDDCSCVGYSFGSGSSCNIFSSNLFNGKSSASPDTVYLKVAKTAEDRLLGKSSTQRVVVIAVVASILGLLALSSAILIVIWCRRRSPKTLSSVLLTSFTYKELQKATKNFSQKLGHGGFGAVFKGSLPEQNTEVAVKRLDNVSQGEKEFHTEVRTLGMIQHINLVRLWGFCAEGSHKLLVYEYMGRGSLDKVLFAKGGPLLDWNIRYNIALGTARALAYLHEECVDRIIHCDIKPENILLDGDFSPKVSDFGLAKLLGRNVSRVITHMRGTRGYLAPEWISNLPITPKADVYSYGMTLLEIVGGRRNIDVNENLDKWHFPLWAYQSLVSGKVSEVRDERLGDDFDVVQVERAVKVGILCIQDEEESRPSMSIVLQMLEGTVDVPMPRMPNSLRMMDVSEPAQVSATHRHNSSVVADEVISISNTFVDGR